jgi:hypothetical protein
VAWTPVLGLAAIWAGLAALALRAFRRAREAMRGAEARSRRERALFVAAALGIALHLIWPAFVGVLLMIVFSGLDLFSRPGPARAPWKAQSRAVDPKYRVAEETSR